MSPGQRVDTTRSDAAERTLPWSPYPCCPHCRHLELMAHSTRCSKCAFEGWQRQLMARWVAGNVAPRMHEPGCPCAGCASVTSRQVAHGLAEVVDTIAGRQR